MLLECDSLKVAPPVHGDVDAANPQRGEYSLATGPSAVRRLMILHNIYAPFGKRILLKAGLKAGMKVADFGCGVGLVSRMLAEIVGPMGKVVGIDASAEQVEQAANICRETGLNNIAFVAADATNTELTRGWFDLVYCRYLLLHLPDPAACLREMYSVLKPGGMIVVEDGDLATATSLPPTALDAFADLFTRLGPTRGVDYSVASRLHQMVKAAGFPNPSMRIHQPAIAQGENRLLLKWSVEEAGSAFVSAGLITPNQLKRTLTAMQAATDDPEVVVLMPRLSAVWARKPALAAAASAKNSEADAVSSPFLRSLRF
jgi:ubiquinone/menaquinone biosynthesis C-methylase UbiE